ncbi:helix-turn-helix transcriptional regulator [Streptomonospora sp. PA3]|uniref:TetR/AcrR family transcriptional regulator n=1 Tax=Streptomonospora sp. PA3 TaxID=2607326 RepID=UPI0012DE5EBA|nr:helix-turn-helix domain-containing protein [Streptomonospora sp. PA3]MUL41170.1 helix-turn-helix transcriptional regulator [Streptomonospora sp. PA3]
MPHPTRAAGLSGRRAQAQRNDSAILDAARTVFLHDPKAPVAAVASRAGVGISALYRRYGGKDDLLRRVCHDGLRRYIAEAETALAEEDGWRAFTSFLRRIVDADVHSLTVHLAGSFAPTAEMRADAARAFELAALLTRRAHESGRLRADFSSADIVLVLEGCAAVRFPDPERTRLLRRRYLALQIAGLDTARAVESESASEKLPGPPATEEELDLRWRR